MRFASLATIGALAATALADGASITAALQSIDKQTLALDSAVNSFDGSSAVAGLPVLVNTLQLQDLLQSGTSTANSSAELTTDEAIALVSPVQQLSKDSNTTLTDLINAYPKFAKNNLITITKNNLVSSKQYADAFSAAIIAKVPASLQSTAQSIAAPIDQAFQNAIDVYSKSPIGTF